MSKTQPFISIIIPVYNDLEGLEKLLPSLTRQSWPADRYEVIVVDNGSKQDPAQITSAHNVTLLYEKDTQSSYAARNKGIQHAKGDIFAFIDSDCRACEDWLSAAMRTMTQTHADLVGGKVTFTLSEKPRAAEYFDAVSNFQFEEKIKRGTCGAGNLFVKKEIFDRIGLFPPHVKSGGDVYFSKKATDSGFKLVYAPHAQVFHPARTLSQLLAKTFRVGRGKAAIKILSKSSQKAQSLKVVQTGSIWSLISPANLKKKLQKSGYPVHLPKFIAILSVACCVHFAGALGLLTGKLLKKP